MESKITKQEAIENKIDKLTPGMLATVALVARKTCSDWKVNNFIKDFANSLGLHFKDDLLYIDVAVRILNYLYPKNRAYWKVQDKLYKEQFNNSCLPGLIKYNNQGGF